MPHLVCAGAEAALHLLEYEGVGEIMDVLLSFQAERGIRWYEESVKETKTSAQERPSRLLSEFSCRPWVILSVCISLLHSDYQSLVSASVQLPFSSSVPP